MGGLTLPSRRSTTVRAVASAWRRLTTHVSASRNGPGEPTLLACSGGGDSSALVLALAAAAGKRSAELFTVAHIVHDLRPSSQALADRDRAADLARHLGLPFVDARVAVRDQPGNDESNARRMRYAALSEIAASRSLRFIATAHNSHDQAESVIMALLRGAGPRGLAGIAPARRLTGASTAESCRVTLIRPMLTVAPDEARELCDQAGWVYAHDQTNDDTDRLRNAIRADIVPRLLTLRPSAVRRIASAADRCREADGVVATLARRLLRSGTDATRREKGAIEWPRESARLAPNAVLGQALRFAAASVGGPGVLDTLTARSITGAVRVIRSTTTDPKTLQWSGVVVRIDTHLVRIERASPVTA